MFAIIYSLEAFGTRTFNQSWLGLWLSDYLLTCAQRDENRMG